MTRRILPLLLLSFVAAPAFAQGAGVWGPGRPIVAPAPPVVVVPVPPPARVSPPRRDVRAQLRQQLAERRAANLARFVAYREAGEFPRNHERPGMLNVFIDAEGHICAAANLMRHDGLLDLVRATAAQNNFLRLADVHEGPLYRWMLSSGLTQDEIATVQEPYDFIPPDMPEEPELEDIEKNRLQFRFRQIERLLTRNTESSLDAAVDALMAYRRAHGIAMNQPVSASGDALVMPTPIVVRPPVARPPAAQPVAQPVVRPDVRPVVTPYVTAPPNLRDPLVWSAR